MANNNNGYVGVSGTYKSISKRYIGVNNVWKEQVEMRVKSFKFTPFNKFASQQRNLGETYPFGGYSKK